MFVSGIRHPGLGFGGMGSDAGGDGGSGGAGGGGDESGLVLGSLGGGILPAQSIRQQFSRYRVLNPMGG